jgi:polar amino acid transport system substrate-binding protein
MSPWTAPLLALLLAAAGAAAEHSPPPTLSLANDPFPPYVQGRVDEKARDGIAVRLVEMALARVDPQRQLEVRLMPWARVLVSAREGQTDGVLFLLKKPERLDHLAFSQPLLKVPLVVFYDRRRYPNGLGFKEIGDLGRFDGVVTRGASYGAEWDALPKERMKLTETSSPAGCIKMLLAGRVVYTPMSLHTGLYLLRQEGLAAEQAVVFDERPISTSAYHLALSKKSPQLGLLPAFDRAIEQLRAEGAIDRLLAGYVQGMER